MKLFKDIWGFLFRLFPCPTAVGLQRIGNPDRESPVLVTCNFHLTVKRLKRVFRKTDAWLLVADSKGVNVWCAAGGDEFNTRAVVSAIKTSGISDLVNHRTAILPPLGGPGISAAEVKKQTGWSVKWGPVRMNDIPRFLERGLVRDPEMKRVTFDWRERLDAGVGSLFIPYLMGALGFAVLGHRLLIHYLIAGVAAFLVFALACPIIPGKRGITKVLFLNGLLAAPLVATWFVPYFDSGAARAGILIAMAMFLIYGFELGGMASTMASDLDPLLARLGIGTVGNLAFAGSVRTDLINGKRQLTCERSSCVGCRQCYEICPIGVWEIDQDGRAFLAHKALCTACRACLVQCETGAVRADWVETIKEKPPLLRAKGVGS